MHIFLTGDRQVGKTTVIQQFLSRSGLSADGLMTYWEPDGDGGRSLYLSSYNADTEAVTRFLVLRDAEQGISPAENIVQVFETHGTEILGNSGKRDVIVMDELGFLESKSTAFQQTVMEHISRDVPILGVIKPRQTEFLDAIRAHVSVTVREVTVGNRIAVLSWLLESWDKRKAF